MARGYKKSSRRKRVVSRRKKMFSKKRSYKKKLVTRGALSRILAKRSELKFKEEYFAASFPIPIDGVNRQNFFWDTTSGEDMIAHTI